MINVVIVSSPMQYLYDITLCLASFKTSSIHSLLETKEIGIRDS